MTAVACCNPDLQESCYCKICFPRFLLKHLRTTNRNKTPKGFMFKYSFQLFHHFSGREAVREFPQSRNQRDNNPRWVRWLQAAPGLHLRARHRRISGRRRGGGGEEEKERQLEKPIWTLLHHRREALGAGALPNSPHLLYSQYLLLHHTPILLLLCALGPARLGFQHRIGSRGWWRRKGAGGHGCQRGDSKIPVTSQERESAKQQRDLNRWAR